MQQQVSSPGPDWTLTPDNSEPADDRSVTCDAARCVLAIGSRYRAVLTLGVCDFFHRLETIRKML
jgi:hypothetical protein